MDRTNLDFGALIQRETKWIVLSMDHTNSSFVPSVSHNISNIAVIESSDRFMHICNGNTVWYAQLLYKYKYYRYTLSTVGSIKQYGQYAK